MDDVQLRVLASGILFRAVLRAKGKATPEEKMAIHQRVEEAAWSLSTSMLLLAEGRDVDDGPPDTPEWRDLVARLATS